MNDKIEILEEKIESKPSSNHLQDANKIKALEFKLKQF